MRTDNSLWDKTIIIKAWVFITLITISLTLDIQSTSTGNVAKSNTTSVNNETNSQHDFHAPFSFLMPQSAQHTNLTSTESPEQMTNRKQRLSTITAFKENNITIAETSVTKQEVISSTTAQPEVTTSRSVSSTSDANTVSTLDYKTITSLKPVSTQKHIASTISKSTVTPGPTTKTSDWTSFSTSSLTSVSTSGLKFVDSSTVTNRLTVTNSKTSQTKDISHVAEINTTKNSTDDSYNSTADPSRLARSFSEDFQSPDSFWPIALALTIGIPTIVVLAVTIAVLYRRRIAKPRSLLSMYGQDYFQN